MTTPSGFSNQPEEQFRSAGQGTLLGTKDLQSAIDKFNQAVEKLAKLYDKAAESVGTFGGAKKGAATANAGGATFTLGSGTGPTAASSGPPGTAPGSLVPAPRRPNGGAPSWGGASAGPVGQAVGGFQGAGGSTRAGPFGMSRPTSAAAGAGMVAAAFTSYGKSQMPGQLGMSSFVQQQQLMMGGAAGGMSGASANAIRFAAYGGHGRNLNNLAQSTADAGQGAGLVSYIAGTPIASFTPRLGAVKGAAGMIGYTNPGMSYTQAAQAAGQIYNPQTSLNLMMQGVRKTPLAIGGKTNQMTAVNTALMQRMFQGRSQISARQFNASFGASGVGTADLQSMFGAAAPQVRTALAAQNQFLNRTHDTPGQLQHLLDQAGQGNSSRSRAAQAALSRGGIDLTAQQRLQNVNATKTGRGADVAGSFNQGLATATNTLQQFNTALSSIISNVPGAKTLVGGAGGVGGTLGTSAHGGNLLQGAAGIGGMLLASRLGGGIGKAGVAGKLGGISSSMGMAAAVEAGATPVWVINQAGGLGGSGGVPGEAGKISGLLNKSPLLGTGSRIGGAAGLPGGAIGMGAAGGAVGAGLYAGNMLKKDIAAYHAGGFKAAAISDLKSAYGFGKNLVNLAAPGTGTSDWAEKAKSMLGFATGGTTTATPAAQKIMNLTQGGVAMGGHDTGKDSLTVRVRPGEGILIPEATAGIGGSDTIKSLNDAFKGKGKHGRAMSESSLLGFAKGGTVPDRTHHGHPPKNSNGGGSAAAVVAEAKKWVGVIPYGAAPGVAYPGDVEGDWLDWTKGRQPNKHTDLDCAGFVNMVYEEVGLKSHSIAAKNGVNVSALRSWGKRVGSKPSDAVTGGFLTLGSDHVELVVGKNRTIQSSQPGQKINYGNFSGATDFFIPPRGFGKGGGNAGGGGGSSSTTSSGGGGGMGSPAGAEVDIIAGALGGSAPGSMSTTTTSGGGGGGGGGGGTPLSGRMKIWAATIRDLETGSPAGNYKQNSGVSGDACTGAYCWNGQAIWQGMAGSSIAKKYANAYDAPKSVQDQVFARREKQWVDKNQLSNAARAWNGGNPNAHAADGYAAKALAEYHHLGGKGGFASGTSGADPGWARVGEQGEELVHFLGGEKVIPAGPTRSILQSGKKGKCAKGGTCGDGCCDKKGYANGTPGWRQQVHRGLSQTSWATTMANGTSQGGGNNVTLEFRPNSIQIKMASTDPNAVSRATREIAHQMKRMIESENMLDNIAAGVH